MCFKSATLVRILTATQIEMALLSGLTVVTETIDTQRT